jgi:RNA polymerase-binding transcription factor DksA
MLTTTQQDHFRAQLEGQRNALQAEAANMQRQIAEPETIVDAVSNLGDEGNMLFAREEAMNELARLAQALAQVERALERLAAGSLSSGLRHYPPPQRWSENTCRSEGRC